MLCIQTPAYKSNYDSAVFKRSAEICKDVGIPFVVTNTAVMRSSIGIFYNSTHLIKKGIVEMNKLLKNDKELIKFLK